MKYSTDSKIFIADDDPFWTAILTQMLNDLGYTDIVSFDNGTDCLTNLRQNPELVFLDYRMEDINGLEVLKEIKKLNPGIGVIFCTAHEDLSIAIEAMNCGSFEYLLKANASKKELSELVQTSNKSLLSTTLSI